MAKFLWSGPEIEDRFKIYWEQCQKENRKATFEGLSRALGVSSHTLYKWANGEYSKVEGDKWDTVRDSLKKCLDVITDDLQQGKTSMDIFRLKQPIYGGYIDKVQQEQSGTLTINVIGAKGAKWGK